MVSVCIIFLPPSRAWLLESFYFCLKPHNSVLKPIITNIVNHNLQIDQELGYIKKWKDTNTLTKKQFIRERIAEMPGTNPAAGS
uniref:Uncharacterized protein n=1 Tax=Rhodnius prolixus TaxID=13249 RepID=T1I923_RHOPR